MNINIQSKSGIPIYEQIEKAVKEAILNGELKKGEPLPSIRALASDLKISVITTKRAYEDLEKEEMIYSVPGKGYYVDDPDVEYLEEKRTIGIEDKARTLIAAAREAGLEKEDVKSMIDILWE